MEAAGHLRAVPDGEIPPNGPQTMGEALQHIHLLEGELERVTDELDGETRSRRAAKGEVTRYRRLLEGKRRTEDREPVIRRILETWRDLCALAPAQVKIVEGSKRWERIVARLEEGWNEEELLLVPTGALTSSWHNGTDPKVNGKRYLEVDTIFRDSEQVEKFVRLARERWDRDFDERLRAFHEAHPSAVFEAIERERQVLELARLDPSVFLPESGEVAAEVVRFEGRTE